MKGWRQHPLAGHALIVAVLLASLGVTRALYVEPRSREVQSLRAEEAALEGRLLDLEAGVRDMDAWAAAHPGRDLLAREERRPRPVREMVPDFLAAVAPIGARHDVRTELIRPAGEPVDASVTDAAGRTTSYRRVELLFHVEAPYQELGEFLREVEALDQLVVVHSVSIQYHADTYPRLAADVAIWVYGTP